jgi:hypothetical protein
MKKWRRSLRTGSWMHMRCVITEHLGVGEQSNERPLFDFIRLASYLLHLVCLGRDLI